MSDPYANVAALRGAVDLSSLLKRSAVPERGASAPANLASGVVIDVDDAALPELLEVSRTVPVVIALWASWEASSVELLPLLAETVQALGGRMILARAEADVNAQLVELFKVQELPVVVAVVAGRPVPMFVGLQTPEVIADLLAQVVELASQHGAGGKIETEIGAAVPADEASDSDKSGSATTETINAEPSPVPSVSPELQTLIDRVAQAEPAASGTPEFICQSADRAVVEGRIEEGFDLMLAGFMNASPEVKITLRKYLVELFEIVGSEDTRVIDARKRLTNLLF